MTTPVIFTGSTEMHGLVNEHDWASSPLGPVTGWPTSLKVLARTVLKSRYPMIVMWGPEFISIYNDGYRQLLGDIHPQLLGASASEVFGESWKAIVPPIEEAMRTGEPSWFPALQLPMNRNGYREETYFTASHAPAEDDNGVVVGMHGVCNDVTEQVIESRRLRLLTELSAAADSLRSVHEMSNELAATLNRFPLDVPFVAISVVNVDGVSQVAGDADPRLTNANPPRQKRRRAMLA